jgi:hypothetical protein
MNTQADDDAAWWIGLLSPSTLQAYSAYHESLGPDADSRLRAARNRKWRNRQRVRLRDFFEIPETNADADSDLNI